MEVSSSQLGSLYHPNQNVINSHQQSLLKFVGMPPYVEKITRILLVLFVVRLVLMKIYAVCHLLQTFKEFERILLETT